MKFRDYITYRAWWGPVCYIISDDITAAYVKNNKLNDTLLRLLYPEGVF